MRLNTLIGTSFAGLVFLFLLLTMFLPMHALSGGGFSVDVDLWGTSLSGGGQSESMDWYDDGIKNEDGIGELRASGPLMIVAIVAAFAAVGLGALSLQNGKLRNMAMIACFAATLFAMISLIMYSVGVDKLSDGDMSDFDNGAAFGLSITGIILSAFAGMMFLLRVDLQSLLVAPLEAE
jgi:hypothetical protein